jgi:hypothetical protein
LAVFAVAAVLGYVGAMRSSNVERRSTLFPICCDAISDAWSTVRRRDDCTAEFSARIRRRTISRRP